ncbi:class I adenylate-forming enzyme family protein [Ammoniphilus sp. YIM 78166]|uniref:class I adenylate-forming enzyme family protein n=1 Tax=Ammoniphilus sp. YIM 78166 TaxID=1644106 RepID=UPI00106F4A8A|nr:long-chain-fatty-acid--CoA ligase [Ammoniphilus sp. YIM 78166]
MLASYEGMSVAQLLEKAYRSSPDKEVIYDGVRRLTYHDLQKEANEIASGLAQLGIKPGDRVAVSLPAWYEFIVCVFAIAKVGAILVPFNTRYREEEAEHILRDSGARLVFFPREYDKVNHLAQFQSLKQRVPSLEHLVTVRFEEQNLVSYKHLKTIGVEGHVPKVEVQVEEDPFAIIYTSGTTGKPKGAMLTHRNLLYVSEKSCSAIRIQENDVFLHASPYFHIMGLAGIIRLVASETKAVIMESFHAEKTLQLIEQEKITIHSGVPTIFILELNHPSFKKYDLSSLRVVIMAGAPCPVEIIRRIKAEMGVAVLISYGMTETSPIITFTDFDDDDVTLSETVGRAIEGVKLKIVNDQREEVAVGEVGELACQTIGLMKGYYNLPDKTNEVIDEQRWFYTGDLATMDENGYVRIVGRKKDMIIRGGYNIYPTEMEEIFYTHSSVMEVSIVGLPDTVLGEISCAAVLLKPEHNVTADELKVFIKSRVADYKVPDHIVIVDELPKTPSGKIKKFELKDLVIQEKLVALR